MAETDTTEATEPEHTEPSAERLDRIEDKVDRLAELVAKVVPGSHAEAQQRTEERLDRGTSLAEQVKAELDKAKRDEADQQAAAAEKTEREQMKADLAKLREKPPAPPRNPLKTFATLGWGDGR